LTSAKSTPSEEADRIHFAAHNEPPCSIRKINRNKPLGEPI
jgi:hypothetical protein